MPPELRADEPVEGEEVFHDVVLDGGRVAVLRLGLDALYVDTYRIRRWVMVVGTVALASPAIARA